jgi:hypothetical protein
VRRNISFPIYLTLWIVAVSVKSAYGSTAYAWKNHDLDIFAGSPPALIFVQDSQNNITGADPTKGLDTYGQGTIIQEIPTSFVEQDHLSSDAVNGVFVPNPTTSWAINIMDHGAETLMVNLEGVSTGVCELWITGLYAVNLKMPKIRRELAILVTTGGTKQIQVTFDPSNRSLGTNFIVKNGDFLKDTQSACGLGDISPISACEALVTLASEAEKNIVNGDQKNEAEDLEVYLSILDHLRFWDQKKQFTNWEDFKDRPECANLCRVEIDSKFVIDRSAYAALKLDAETLLEPLKKSGDFDWRDGHR